MTVLEAHRFSSLVGEIYDAAVDPVRRSAVLEQVAGFVGGSAVTILSRDAARISIEIHQHYGTDSRFRDLYRDRYVDLDPLLDRHLDLAVEQTVGVADVMPYSDFIATSFYREWLEPQGAVDLATVTLARSNARTTILQVMRSRSRGVVDDSMRERMRLIAPHIQRSRVMSKQIRARSHTVADIAEVLDRLSTAICLFDADGRIVNANAACRLMFADGDLIANVGDRIVARNTPADKILRSLFDILSNRTSLTGRGKIELMTSTGGQHYLAHAFPMTHARNLQRDGVATVLFLQKASMAPQLATAALTAAFRLTPSELRVLMAIVEFGGVPDIAAKLGFVAGDCVSLRVPRRVLAPVIMDVDDAVMRVIRDRQTEIKVLVDYATSLVREHAQATPALRELGAGHLHELLALVLGPTDDVRESAGRRGTKAARLRKAKFLIANNCWRQDLSVGGVAQELRVTPRYLQRLLEADGKTFSSFLIEQRLKRAHRMLREPDFAERPVSSIAYDVGFGDLSYFNRCFRRAYGATPSDVRRGASE